MSQERQELSVSKKKTRVELTCSDEEMQLKDSPYQPRSDKKLLICYGILLSDTQIPIYCVISQWKLAGPLEGNLKEII